jgi:cation diffusion facilitator family transporter
MTSASSQAAHLDPQRRHRLSMRAVNLGLFANAGLAAVKTVVGVLGGSAALLADGINSTSDVAYYLVVRVFIELARKPADTEHPYGHTQLESIAAVVVGSFVITTAVAIFWDSVNKVYSLLTGEAQSDGAAAIALAVALLTVVIKIVLMVVTLRIKRETGNAAVSALAYDHRNDIFSASAAALGIFLSRNGLPWVDPLAGALVALLVLRTGIKILQDASAELMDDVPSKELAQEIQGLVSAVPDVKKVEEVYAHRFGPYLVVNLTIGIDGSLSVLAGDTISSAVECTLYENVPLLRGVHVHYHPVGTALVSDTGASPGGAVPRSVKDW